MTLSEAIRALRAGRLMTQDEFAAYLKVSRPSIAAWEAGIRTPAPPFMRKLVKAGLDRDLAVAATAKAAKGAAA